MKLIKVIALIVIFAVSMALCSCKAFRLTTEGTEVVIESAHIINT